MAGDRRKSRKIRVDFQKNRGKRARSGDLTRRSHQDLDELADLDSGERLSGKGKLTRRRTIIAAGEGGGDIVHDPRTEGLVEGRVLAAIGANNCRVQTETGEVITCSIRRVVRTLAREGRSAVVAGDRVLVSPSRNDEGVIERVQPRSSTLTRVSGNAAHVIVANVDQAVIVASADEPPLKLGLIDRFLCSAEKGEIRGIVCINKIDLGRRDMLQPIVGQYARLGYPVVLSNALSGDGIPELERLLRNRETVFTGQSGVGKSSLLNALQPGLGRVTREISDETGKGRHTTRVTELLKLDAGGWVVDTPGIRQLQLWDVAREDVEGLFVEFRPFVSRCRFPDCSHVHEADCGVKQAVEREWISPLRYASYARIASGIDDSR